MFNAPILCKGNDFIKFFWRFIQAINDALREELVRVSAAFADSDTVANQFRMLASNPAFSEFASEVVPLIGQVESIEVNAIAIYDKLRKPSS